MEKVTVCIPTKDREGILSIELSSLIKYKHIIAEIVLLNVSENDFSSEELKQVFGVLENEEVKIRIFKKQLKLLEAREFLISKANTSVIWMMDDDMFIAKGVEECLQLMDTFDIVGFMVPNADNVKNHTKEFVDKFTICDEAKVVYSEEGNAMIGGIYFVKKNLPFCFENNLEETEPGEDRIIFKNISKKGLYTKAVAYHMTSEKIGSNFDYEKYFGEKNMMWE